jgi:DNA topoisomerase VI subunit B
MECKWGRLEERPMAVKKAKKKLQKKAKKAPVKKSRAGARISQLALFGGAEKRAIPQEKIPPKEKPTRAAKADAAASKKKEEAPVVESEETAEVSLDVRESDSGKKKGAKTHAAADWMAKQQREISVSEFFTKNRHLLGFDNPQKALLTAVKEAVDNSLDACEESRILPEVEIFIEELSESRYRIRITDNGPGIVRAQIPKVFGKLLYGSKFHRLKQSRGQQGIGISAAGMYGQLTTGKPVVITSRVEKRPAIRFEIKIDTRRNEPQTLEQREVDWEYPHGTRVEMEIEGLYRGGKRSVDQYIEQTAIATPHATVRYRNPKGEQVVFERLSHELPPEPIQIKPHPHGVELGILANMAKDTRAKDLKGMLSHDFSRVSGRVAVAICEIAGLNPSMKPRDLVMEEVERLHRAMGSVKIMNPPTACVVPIGEELIQKGLQKGMQADFVTSTTRPPAVYRGNPFIVEAGLAWGGGLPADELCSLFRFANRVPLQYQQSDCSITKAVMDTDWRNYKVSQARGALPSGPLVIMVHVASVWVPFTSESKEAVARYPEILREIRLALQTCGRKLAQHLSARRKEAEEGRKRSYIETYIPHIGIALKEILSLNDREEKKVVDTLTDTLRKSRASA